MKNATVLFPKLLASSILAVPLLYFAMMTELHAQNQKIALNDSNLITVESLADPVTLLDEQSLAGDPANGNGGQPQTSFSPGYSDLYLPARILIDFKSDHYVEDLWYYDINGRDTARIYTGNPGNWRFQCEMVTNKYNSWQSLNIEDTSRFVRLDFKSNQAQVNELIFYGRDLGSGQSTPPAPISRKNPQMGDFVGVNGFVDDPYPILENAAGTVREYHNWQWNEGDQDTSYTGFPQNQYAFAPSWVPSFNFDDYYTELKNRGVTVAPCLQTTPPYIRGDRHPDIKPLYPGEDASYPENYREHADYLFQYAARYGSQNVADSLLKLRADQPRKSGMNLLRYVENWNEPEKWWRGEEGQFDPFEFAAMSSADYDGHLGSLGANVGLKNADSSLKMVMGGLAGLNLQFIESMRLWSEFNRQGSFPADVLNFHHYSNDAGGQRGQATQGISPEADSLKQKLKKLVAYRDKWLPGKEIWLSEFGYDTNPRSAQGVRPVGDNDVYEVQAQWLVRSYLEIAAAGIDRAMMYMTRDIYEENPTRYNSSGLTHEKWTDHEPKKSYYYVSALRHLLANFRFSRELNSGDSRVNFYEFNHDRGDSLAYAVWCNTTQDTELPAFKLGLPDAARAYLYQLKDGVLHPSDSLLPVQNDSVVVPVSERPVFLKVVHHDSLPPVAQTRDIVAYLDENGEASISASAVDSGSYDETALIERKLSRNHFTCADLPGQQDTAQITLEFYASDHLNTDTAQFQLSLKDTIAPTAVAKPVHAYFGANGVASVSALAADDSSYDNCASITERWLADSVWNCAALTNSGPLVVVSDASWQRSTFVNQADASGWPWPGTDTLPPATTFTESAELGQPYHWHSVDSVAGSRPVKAGNFVRYYRRTFQVDSADVFSKARFFMTVDDNMAIYLNGHLLARENGYTGSSGSDAVHGFSLGADGTVEDGIAGSTPFVHTYAQGLNDILHSGENEVLLAVHNYNNLGGFSFRMELERRAVQTRLHVQDAHGRSASAPVYVVLHDTLQACGSFKRLSNGTDGGTNSRSQYQIYPNPTRGLLQLSLPGDEDSRVEMQLFSASGQRLRSRECFDCSRVQLDLGDLQSGAYMLRIVSGEGSTQRRIIKL